MKLSEKIDMSVVGRARKARTGELTKSQQIVLAVIQFAFKAGAKGVTQDECIAMLDRRGIKGHYGSISARLDEMAKEAGILLASGRERMTSSGGKGTVFLLRKGATLQDYNMRERSIGAAKTNDEKAVIAAYRLLRGRWETSDRKERATMMMKMNEVVIQVVQKTIQKHEADLRDAASA